MWLLCPSTVLSNSNSNTNEADNTAYGVSAAHTQSNPTTGDNLSDALGDSSRVVISDTEEDLKDPS
ncbi:hypothetical protein Tco_0350139, partial [Tanacetum coccineum]